MDAAHVAALETHGAMAARGDAGVARVKRGKANMFLDGCPIVYAGAIEATEGKVKTGDWVCVTDHAKAPICVGFYNETSSYAVRALAIAEGVAPLEGLTVDMAHVQVRCF